MKKVDAVIAGAGFAGLACAKELAASGLKVVVLEKKKQPGLGIHTTGILVKEAAKAFNVPESLTKRITKIRLYSPSLKVLELNSPAYYFLTTDTPELMRTMSREAENAGAEIRYGEPFSAGEAAGDEITLPRQNLKCRYLIGADGPRSRVAGAFGLGKNRKFLTGAEAELENTPLPDDETFYCFLDQNLAKGYLGWVIPGVGITQAGLATLGPGKPDLEGFMGKVSKIIPLDKKNIIGRRGGLIPVGGLVSPAGRRNVLLLGDAAGTVSPLTGGGIHTALHFGQRAGKILASGAPLASISKSYPRFYAKHVLRFGFENLAPDWLLDRVIGNGLFRKFSETVFFRKKRL